MFKVTVNKEALYKQYKDFYRHHYGGSAQNIINRMSENGVILNSYALGRYLGITISEVIEITKQVKIPSVLHGTLPYYFRGDIWDFLPELYKHIEKIMPDNPHLKNIDDPLVDMFDVCFYYGLTRTVGHTLINRFGLHRHSIRRTHTFFYKYSDILKIKESKLFRETLSKRRMPVSADISEKIQILDIAEIESRIRNKEETVPFRDRDCDKYDDCLSVAAWTTDYMDCTKCFWYQLSQGEVQSYSFDPVIVFTPKRAESNQKIRALKKLKQLPNAITN